jgi:biopolymer transport protein TolR
MAGGASYRTANGQTARYQPMSEINVTPFVDVMLVLLVVFMITAPLLTVGVEIDLPKAESEALSGDDEPLTVSIDAEGQLFLQETQIEIDELGPKLIAITGENPEARIFIRGDQAIDYGRVMQVMSTINMAGFTKVALITVTPIGEKPGG